MRRFLATAVASLSVTVGLVATTFTGATPSSGATHEVREKAPGILFAVSGSGATMKPLPGSKDRYELIVASPDRAAVWFADRPVRDSGTVPTAWLVSAWSTLGFDRDPPPPNVAIAVHRPRGDTDTIVAVMRHPVIMKTGALRATMRVLSADEAHALTGHLAQHGQDHDPVGIPAHLGAVSIFIDDVSSVTPPPPCPGASCRTPGKQK